MWNRKDYFTENNSAKLGGRCAWSQGTSDFYFDSIYYVRILANNTFGSTTSEFQFDAIESGTDSDSDADDEAAAVAGDGDGEWDATNS